MSVGTQERNTRWNSIIAIVGLLFTAVGIALAIVYGDQNPANVLTRLGIAIVLLIAYAFVCWRIYDRHRDQPRNAFSSFALATGVLLLLLTGTWVLFQPSVEVTSSGTEEVILLEGYDDEGTFRVNGTISNIDFDPQRVYLLATDRDNPNTWWIYRADPPENGLWSAEVQAGNVWAGKKVNAIAVVTHYRNVESIEPNENGERTVRSPEEISPKAQSDEEVITLGPLIEQS